jgi:AcrR family transcriptional regulator
MAAEPAEEMSAAATELLGTLAAEADAAQGRAVGTRARLLRAAAEAIEEGGYGAASVAAISKRAGVAAGALYRHFPSKAELFVELFRRAAEQELEAMHAVAGHGTNLEKLDAVLRTYATRALATRRLTWALVYEPVDPLVDVERLTYRRRYREGMAGLIGEAVAAGEIPAQNADLSAAAVVGAMAEALVGPLSPVASQHVSEAEIVTAIVELCRRAIGAPARH